MDKKFECKPCGYTTDRKNDLSKHNQTRKHIDKTKKKKTKTKDNKSPKKYTKRSYLPLNLNQNVITKINNEYNCEHCCKKFNALLDIEKHIKLECITDIRYDNFYVISEDSKGSSIFPSNINSGEIYIIQTDFSLNHVYKIGITQNLEDRIRHYRTGCKYEPRLHYYFPCKNIKKADTILKNALADYNIKREIYKGNIESLKNIILENLKEINGNKIECYKPDIILNDVCECVDCDKIFLMTNDLVEHQKNCNGKQQQKKYLCKFCNEIFNSNSGLSKHRKVCYERIHLIDNYEKLKGDLTNKDNYNSKLVIDLQKRIDELEADKKLLAKQLETLQKVVDKLSE